MKKITHEHIPNLSQNIRAVYRFLHPEGLEEAELAKLAGEHNFYRVIYQNYQKEQGAQ